MTEDPRRRGPRWVSRAARVQEAVDDERRASGASSTSGLLREGSCCGRGLSKEARQKKEKETKKKRMKFEVAPAPAGSCCFGDRLSRGIFFSADARLSRINAASLRNENLRQRESTRQAIRPR